ncbi:MAG: C40 family peptidase [Inquilinus sp.]|uniref:C40 family peptidase n=1 Tax=Inquilinus sp. TaxID=1932117 RepID=UPI003F374F5F
MSWSDAYVGLPWLDVGRDRAGVDCYGLARLPIWEIDGIELPSFAGAYASASEREAVAALIAGERHSLARPVSADDLRPRDLILMRRGLLADHVGLWVRPGLMLHIRPGRDSECEEYDAPLWRNRIVGFFRAEGQALQRMK